MSEEDIVQMMMVNLETGETWDMNYHFFFAPALHITAIVKVQEVEYSVLPNDSLEVSIDCLGLYYIGAVFHVKMVLFPDSTNKLDTILRDMQVDSFWMITGQYSFSCEDCLILAYDPTYTEIIDYTDPELRVVFRVGKATGTENSHFLD